ncbi:MAG: 1-(5-phosphoribosyl)-5-[(5-phosphoribosylamino)methylideneamino]imidazole-4-carboxamide isomerase [Halanaerobiaceae bacterium]
MEIIPAIDLKDGRCVRLLRGDYDQETVYSKDPVEMALRWQKQGATRLHLVDLDGAKDGKPVNLELVKEITSALDIPVQLGGGIRSMAIIDDYIAAGIDRLILGTIALQKPEVVKEAVDKYGPDKIVVGVDAKGGKVAVNGWLEESRKTVEEMIQEMKELGVKIFIYTDISKDGTLEGPDLEGLDKYNQIEGIELIASGGVSNFDDLKELQKINIGSVITGKALYTGDLSGDFLELNKRLRNEG